MHRVIALFLSAILLSGAAVHTALAQDPPPPPPGATSCSGCHGPLADPALSLAGLSAPDIVQAMTDFSSGVRPATIMDRIARGFTEPEIKAIADWLEESKK